MSVSTEVLNRAAFQLDQLEREINNMVGPHRPRGTVQPLSPMPDYVEHRNGVNEVGKLSAEAVVRESAFSGHLHQRWYASSSPAGQR
jgi:hypothetical protein